MKIVTHGGTSHADEILAIALIMIKEGIESPYEFDLVRSVEECRAREYADADFVVDVGKDFDPRKGWFDHHQFPRDAKPACAFTLVARKYGVDLTRFLWAEKLAVLDSKGPFAWYETIVGRSPKDGREMARGIGAGDSFFSYLGALGNIDFRRALRVARDWLQFQFDNADAQARAVEEALKISQIIDLGTFKMAYFDVRSPRGLLAATDKLMQEDEAIIVSGMLSERGDGYSVVRMNDNPRVDFSAREGEEGCVFAHKGGFMMNWRRNWDEFLEAIKRSVC